MGVWLFAEATYSSKYTNGCLIPIASSHFCCLSSFSAASEHSQQPHDLLEKHVILQFFSILFFLSFFTTRVTLCCNNHIRLFSHYYQAIGSSMEHSLQYEALQFAVNTQFEDFSALKHACTCTALLDIFEFVPDQVTSECYRLVCKDKECSWLLYASIIAGTDFGQI